LRREQGVFFRGAKMSEDIDGVVTSTGGKSSGMVIVISGRLPKKEAEALLMELQKTVGKYKGVKVEVKKS
jgi:hypothetical protein